MTRPAFMRLLYLAGLTAWLAAGYLVAAPVYPLPETVAVEMGVVAAWTVGWRWGTRSP